MSAFIAKLIQVANYAHAIARRLQRRRSTGAMMLPRKPQLRRISRDSPLRLEQQPRG
jgi:hypothetical protein